MGNRPLGNNTGVAIPQSFIQELLTRTDVVELIGRHVQLKKGGANYMGLCPFHGEKSPSFSVSPTKQFFHCFGCGKHGDAIGFLMEHAGLDFVEAVQELAQQVGLTVPQEQSSPEQREAAARQRATQHSLSDLLETAAQAYRSRLRDSPTAIAYCKQRGLSGAVAQRYGLGYAPPGWRTLAGVFAQYDDPQLVACGLVIAEAEGEGDKRYDRFRDRLMFPIRNIKGECIGFGGRVLGDEKPKYLNSPETPVFSKGYELYGLFEARQAIRESGYVLVTEGYMDVVALAQLGFAHAVATLGTACTEHHVQKLFRVTEHVVFSFDGDAAGRRAARKALETVLPLASDARRVRFLFLPPEHDPDSYIRAHGTDAFAHQVHEAVPLSRFLLDSAREGCDLASAEGRATLALQARPLWARLPQGMLRRQLLNELAALLQVPATELTHTWQMGANADAASARRYAIDSNARSATPHAASAAPRERLPRSRADHATRIALGHMHLLEQLTDDDRHLLCQLPAPHGEVLGWLDQQLHEHGPQPWAALREGLRGHTMESYACGLMESDFDAPESNPAELLQELREILRRQRIAVLKSEEKAAIAAYGSDPSARERYQQIQARRRDLEAGSKVSAGPKDA